MQSIKFLTRAGIGAAVLASSCLPNLVHGQDRAGLGSVAAVTKSTTEPVFRVSRLGTGNLGPSSHTTTAIGAAPTRAKTNSANVPGMMNRGSLAVGPKTVIPVKPDVALAKPDVAPVKPAAVAHPLDRALAFANESLASMRGNVYDYTARMAKRERINGSLSKTSYMDIKIRCPRVTPQGQQTPFSIYMKFLRPRDASGREVLWVDGRDKGNLLAHQPGGLIGMKTFELSPTGMMAMQGQRYPIYEAGLENMIVKLIEKASRDRAAGMCEVTYRDGLAMNERSCSLIEVLHHQKRAPYEFHKAQVLIDNELNIPVRYTSYDWPKSPGAKPEILEQYTYLNVNVNVGLTDKDFDPSNAAYDFPGR